MAIDTLSPVNPLEPIHMALGAVTNDDAPLKPIASSQRCEPGSVNVPVCSWPEAAKSSKYDQVDPSAIARNVFDSFNLALEKGDHKSASDLFLKDGLWRDHLASTWDLRTFKGQDKIQSSLESQSRLKRLDVDESSDWRKSKILSFSPVDDVPGMQLYINAEMVDGTARGMARLVEQDGQWRIWMLFTSRESIKGHEENIGPKRPKGVEHGGMPGRKNWLDRRIDELNVVDREPDVLIIGAGQGGLTAHARLKMLGVSALIVDMNDRVGDNWRKRYHQLVLHDPVWYDHLPYLKFPDSWPVFTPKDKLADWFDSYANALELNIWMRSSLVSSSWDDEKKEWTVNIKRGYPDGHSEIKTLHPKHIIQATGHSGKKHFPDIPGMDKFEGLLCHSSDFPGAKESTSGKKAVVVGACNSSHDICQDYYEKGYDVTMIQRSTTCVVSSEAATEILLGGVYEEGGPPVEDADLWLWGWPAEAHKRLNQDITKLQLKKDAQLLEGLERAGFKLDSGPDDCGLFSKYLQRGGGYYFDVGASQLIIDGKIKVKQGQEVAEILANGLKLADGTILEADEIIFATGYENMRTQARIIFGDELADRVGDIWGYDNEGEMRTLWRSSGHPGFWFHGGNLAICRYYSKMLALQIKARLEGLSN